MKQIKELVKIVEAQYFTRAELKKTYSINKLDRIADEEERRRKRVAKMMSKISLDKLMSE
jgi:hypothetical protein